MHEHALMTMLSGTRLPSRPSALMCLGWRISGQRSRHPEVREVSRVIFTPKHPVSDTRAGYLLQPLVQPRA